MVAKTLRLESDKAPNAAKRTEFEEQIHELINVYAMQDISRRIEISIDLDQEPQARSPISAFSRIFMSRGFLGDLKGAGKLLSYASKVFLVMSLVSLGSGTMASEISNRRAQLQDLYINAELQKSQQELQQSSNQSPAPSTSSDEDQRAANYVARQFEVALSRDPVWQKLADPVAVKDVEKAKREFVRSAVQLELNSEPPNDNGVEWRPLEKEAAIDLSRTARADGPMTKSGDAFLNDWFHESFGSLLPKTTLSQRIAEHMAAYSKPVQVDELHAWAVSNAVGSLLDLGTPTTSSEFSKQVVKATSSSVSSAATKYYKIKRNDFLLTLVRGGSINDAVSSVAESHPYAMPQEAGQQISALFKDWSSPDFEKKTRRSSDLAYSTKASNESDLRQVVTDIREIARKSKTDPIPVDAVLSVDDEALSYIISSYSTEFPLDNSSIAARTALMTEWNGSEVATKEALSDVARSQDFEALSSYARVGGILIGRDPSDRQGAEFVDLKWHITNGNILLTLIRKDGKQFDLDPYPLGLVRSALLYATDTRPVAVTTLYAPTISRDQILLHPILQDTPFGCRVLNDDKWIFDITEKDGSAVERAIEVGDVQVSVYKEVLKSASINENGHESDPIRLTDKQLAMLSTAGDPSVSPLSNSEFDQNVVRAVKPKVMPPDRSR